MSHCSSQTQLTLKLNDHLHSTDEIFNATCLLKEEVKDLKAEQKELKETVAILKNRPTKDKADKWNTIEKWLFAGVLSFLSGSVIYIIKNGMVKNVVG